MTANVIHDENRQDRLLTLTQEMKTQEFAVRLWPALKHDKSCTGIARAHKQIVLWAKEQGLPEVLIMEDDVRFCGPGAFQYFLDIKPNEFDLYLSGVYFGNVQDGRIGDFSGLHCYIVASKFYDTFLSCPDGKHIDRWLSKQHGVYYCCTPFAAIQHNGLSDNVGKTTNYDHLLVGRKLYNNYQL